MKRDRYLVQMALAIAALLLIGCGSPQPKQASIQPPPAITVLIAPPAATVTVGSVQTFSAKQITNSIAQPCNACVWQTDNPAVATVSQGTVSTWAAGSAKIRASLGPATSDPVTLTVQAPPPTGPPPTSLAGTWKGVISSTGYADGQFQIPMVRGSLCTSGDNPDGCYQSDDFATDEQGTFCMLLGPYSMTADVTLDGTIAFQIVEKDYGWATYNGVLPPLDSYLKTQGTWTEDMSPSSSPCSVPYGTAGALSLVVVPGP